MTTDEMLAALAEHGIDSAPFPMRVQPDGEHPGDKVFRFPVQLDDGRFLAVAWSFGQSDPDEMLNWLPHWHSVDGPMSLAELQELARAGA